MILLVENAAFFQGNGMIACCVFSGGYKLESEWQRDLFSRQDNIPTEISGLVFLGFGMGLFNKTHD